MIKNLNIAVLSDLHLGHRRNKALDIIANLNKAFPDNEDTAQLDIIFLAGDVFDRLLEYPDESVVDINIWIFNLLQICSKHDILLRVLEGTPSHDRFQSEAFNTIKHISNLKVDLKYIKTLSIEYIEKFDIQVGYIPDEWEITTEKTLEQFKDLLQSKNLSQVDFLIMHGNFEFQMPAHLNKIPKHDSNEYLKLVKHYIFIGHIHNFSFNKRIIAQGSFDRLAHGEEEAKGHVRATITENGEREFFFIENKDAKVYKTFKCYFLDLEQTLKHLEELIKDLPANANVRIEAESEHIIFSNMNHLILLYPTITWSKLPKNDINIEEEIYYEEEEEDYIPITINKDNVISLLMFRITSLNLEANIVSKSEQLLKEIVNDLN